jgi:hypothetical protein
LVADTADEQSFPVPNKNPVAHLVQVALAAKVHSAHPYPHGSHLLLAVSATYPTGQAANQPTPLTNRVKPVSGSHLPVPVFLVDPA